jgi:hypothetical protein
MKLLVICSIFLCFGLKSANGQEGQREPEVKPEGPMLKNIGRLMVRSYYDIIVKMTYVDVKFARL